MADRKDAPGVLNCIKFREKDLGRSKRKSYIDRAKVVAGWVYWLRKRKFSVA